MSPVAKKDGRTAKYILLGDPTSMARVHQSSRRTWETQRDVKLVSSIHLQSQHEGPPFIGPIHLEICFFMPLPPKAAKCFNNTDHFNRPALTNLIQFVEGISTGILYANDCIISEIVSRKKYSDSPRTELIITQI